MRVSSPFVLLLWISRVCLRPEPSRRSARRPSGCRGRCLNFQFPRNRPVLSFCQGAGVDEGAGVAVGETVMMPPPSSFRGVLGMECQRGCQQFDSLADSRRVLAS